MPYIKREEREEYEETLGDLVNKLNGKPIGHLTYIIYYLMLGWIYNHGKSYQKLSEICGAVRDAEMEFRREQMNPYEDDKRRTNGDIIL